MQPPSNPQEFEEFVKAKLQLLNDWHLTVDAKLATLEGRTRDIRLILIGTIFTAVAALVDVLLRAAGR